jgi:hypothetical protein
MTTKIKHRCTCRSLAVQVFTLCCLVFCPSLSSPSAAAVYDLKTDWSDLINPNGPWSYREGNNLLSHVADWQGLSGDFTGVQPAWARFQTGSSNLPPWMKIVSPAGVPNDWQFGDIVTHSTDGFNGIGSGLSNVIWTSPLNGTIDVSGGTWMGRDIGRGNHWDISLNGISLTGGDIFSGDSFDRSNPFAFAAGSGGPAVLSQIPVVVGDVLRLQFTKTSGPGDYAGVNLTITAIPEPAGVVAALIGFSGLLVWRQRYWFARSSGPVRQAERREPLDDHNQLRETS